NGEFAINFSSLCNTPSNRFNICWRVISDNDVVCNVPVGFDNPELLQYICNNYIFDYAHVGEAIRLFQDGRRPETQIPNLLKDEKDVSRAEPVNPAALDDDKQDRFMPPFVKDHSLKNSLLKQTNQTIDDPCGSSPEDPSAGCFKHGFADR
ncbi:9862_t:CDS:2, partial [Paraglomus occultum]